MTSPFAAFGVSVSSCLAASGLQIGLQEPLGSATPPSLLGSLAGDAEPGADLGPGVAAVPQALDRLGDGGVDLLGQAEHEGQGVNVAIADAAAVGAQDAPDECAVLVVLDPPSPPF